MKKLDEAPEVKKEELIYSEEGTVLIGFPELPKNPVGFPEGSEL